MQRGKAIALVASGLVAGLVLGSLGIATAVTPSEGAAPQESDAPTWCPEPMWRAGKAIGAAGGRLVDVVSDLTGLAADDVAEKRHAGESFADIAESEGVSASDVVDEALSIRKELLAEKVEDGTITQEQADEMLENMQSRLSEHVESTDQRGPRGRGMGHRAAGGVVREMSDLTGLSAQEILERRQSGESFEAIAESKGVSADELISAALKTAGEHIARAVEERGLPQEQADEMLKNLEAHLTEIIASTDELPAPPSGGRGPGGGHSGQKGMGGFGPGSEGGAGAEGAGPTVPMTY
jgi:uncharacterized protein (DUF433 family)